MPSLLGRGFRNLTVLICISLYFFLNYPSIKNSRDGVMVARGLVVLSFQESSCDPPSIWVRFPVPATAKSLWLESSAQRPQPYFFFFDSSCCGGGVWEVLVLLKSCMNFHRVTRIMHNGGPDIEHHCPTVPLLRRYGGAATVL